MTIVSEIILSQLGGHKFVAMTGAKNLVRSDNSLKMDVPHAKCNGKYIRGIRIILNDNDLYTIEAFKIAKFQYVVVDSKSDIFVENLRNVFTLLTGVYTSL